MSFDIFVIQLVCLSCIFFLLRAAYLPKGWVVLAGGVLIATGSTFLVAPAQTAWVSGGLWLGLVLLPLLGLARVNGLVAQEQYRRAYQLVCVIRWFHPMDGLLEYPQLLRGLQLGQQGKMDQALRIFNQYQTAATSTGRTATVLLYRMGARWEEALQWIESNLSSKTIFTDVTVGVVYLRSLGETGNLNRLLHSLERFERELEKTGDPFTLSLVRMFALAFCGQVDRVQEAFHTSLATYPEHVRQFWVATAELAAGNEAVARRKLLDQRELANQPDAAHRNAINWRLTQAPVNLHEVLTDSSRQILLRLRTDLGHEAQYSFRHVLKSRNTYAAYILIAANIAMFALEETLGGSQNPATLYRLGALIPELVIGGEWWRTLTANFLHFNLLHLLTNMVGLYLFGRFVEAIFGVGRFLVAYFFAGIGAMLTVATLAVLTGTPDIVCVGASGAVMGLLGVVGAILLRGWQRENVRFAGRQLRLVLVVIGLQITSDLLNPEVSLIGHISGLIFGFGMGYMLAATRPSINPHLER